MSANPSVCITEYTPAIWAEKRLAIQQDCRARVEHLFRNICLLTRFVTGLVTETGITVYLPIGEVIRNQLGNPIVEQLAALIGGPDVPEKAGGVLSLDSGLFVGRLSFGAESLAREEDEVLPPMLTAALQTALSGRTS